jgi:signal transduction histidine kinase
VLSANEQELLEGLAVGVLLMDARGSEVMETARAQQLLAGTLLADPDRRSRRLSSLAQRCRDGGPAAEFFEASQGEGAGLRLSASALADGRTLFTVEAMEASDRVDERVRQFVAHLTHDLRTPLTSIMGASDLLLSGRLGETNERHERLLRIVSESTERMASLLSEITTRFVAPEAEGASQ